MKKYGSTADGTVTDLPTARAEANYIATKRMENFQYEGDV
jgi:hypothetical protein